MMTLIAQIEPKVGFSFMSEHFWGDIVAAAAFGLVGIVLLLLGYFLFDLVTPRIDVQKELSEKNMAVALVVASLLFGIAYIAAHVVSA
jgi:putative membrane protein